MRVLLQAVDSHEPLPVPEDLLSGLRESDTFPRFQRLPVGKRNHIVLWLEESVQEETRLRRIEKVIRVMMTLSENERDREARQSARRTRAGSKRIARKSGLQEAAIIAKTKRPAAGASTAKSQAVTRKSKSRA